jgi:hypothetical protein
MKENEKNQESISLPPPWCGAICRNAMNEVCIEYCAIKRDCSFFEAKPNLKLIDMPRFPQTKDMTKEEKFTSVTVYLSKVVDHLQGEPDEYTLPIRRSDLHRTRSSSLPENLKIENLLSDFQERDPSPENRKEHQDPTSRSSELDEQTSQAT